VSDPRYPRGRLIREDEGSTQFAIGLLPDRKTLVIEFFKPIKWLGLAAKDVDALIAALTDRRGDMLEATNVDYE